MVRIRLSFGGYMHRPLLALLCMPLLLFAGTSYTYKSAIKQAINSGRKANILREQWRVSGYGLAAAKAQLQPIWSISGSRNTTGAAKADVSWQQQFASGATVTAGYDFLQKQASLTAKQPLLRGWQQNNQSLQNSNIAFAQAHLMQIKSYQAIIQEVLAAYWQVISAQKNRQVQIIGRKSAQKLYQQYKIKVDMGLLPRLSLVEQTAQMQRFDLEELQQKTAGMKAIENLKLLLNLPSNAEVDLIEDIKLDSFGKTPELTKAVQVLEQNNVEIKNAMLALTAAKINYEIAKNAALPDFSLTSTMQSKQTSFGAELHVPINDPGLKQNLLTAKSNLAQARQNYLQVKQDKVRVLQNILVELNSRAQEHKILVTNTKISQHLYELTRQQYKYGKASSLDVITRQKHLVSDQQAVISNDILYLTAYIKMLAEQGQLLTYFGIKI